MAARDIILAQVDAEFGMGKKPYVSEEEMYAFDRAAHLLFQDMLTAFNFPPPGHEVGFMPVNLGAYGSWLATWRLWMENHRTTLSRLGNDPRVEMNRFIRQYDIYRMAFRKAGGPTDSPKISENTEGLFAGLGDALKYLAIAAVAFAGIYAMAMLPRGR